MSWDSEEVSQKQGIWDNFLKITYTSIFASLIFVLSKGPVSSIYILNTTFIDFAVFYTESPFKYVSWKSNTLGKKMQSVIS